MTTEQKKRFVRSTNNRQIAGVCGGIADYLNIDVTLVRLLCFVLLLGGEGILLYILLWAIVPEGETDSNNNTLINIYRSRTERSISGVCGGIAEYFNVDVTLVRLVFVIAAVTGGTGFILYIALALVLPEEPLYEKEKPKRQFSEEATL